jgi:hypothetical protein
MRQYIKEYDLFGQEYLSWKTFKKDDKYFTIQIQKEERFKNIIDIHIWNKKIDKEFRFNFPIFPELFSDLFLIWVNLFLILTKNKS